MAVATDQAAQAAGPGAPTLRLDHVLCFSGATSVDDHIAEYTRLGFVPQAHAARWPPGLRNRFIGLWPEYLELVWVEDGGAFAASDDPITRHRAGGRPFGLGLMSDDLPALHGRWRDLGLKVPDITYESPEGAASAAPLFAFVEIPVSLLPGVDGFALTSYYRPVPPTRHQVWIAPNSVFAMSGVTLAAEEPESQAEAWRSLLAPSATIRTIAGGVELDAGPHRLTWLTPEALERRHGIRWSPNGTGADAIALIELLAVDLERVARYARDAGRPALPAEDGALLLKPSENDGFRFLVRAGSTDAWVARRNASLGSAHDVLRIDEFMARGTPGDGEYVLRAATRDDLAAIRELGSEVLPETYGSITPAGYADMLLEEYWSDAANLAAIESATDELIVAESPISGVLGVAHTAAYGEGTVILWRLYVTARVRRRGIGRALVEECMRRCDPAVSTFMTEYLTANHRAAEFYASAGFAPAREEELSWHGIRIAVTYVARARA